MVNCRPGTASFSAVKAGDVISTSPAPSSRTQSSLRSRFHVECIAIVDGVLRRSTGRHQYQTHRLAQRIREVVRLPVQTEPPFGLVTGVHEHGLAARAIAGL